MATNTPQDLKETAEAIAGTMEQKWASEPGSPHAYTQMNNAGIALILHCDLARIADALEKLAGAVRINGMGAAYIHVQGHVTAEAP